MSDVMKLDKLTQLFQMALSDAQSLAIADNSPYIEAPHVMLAMLNQPDGTISPLLELCSIDVRSNSLDIDTA